MSVTNSEQLVIHDGAGEGEEDDESNEVVFDVGTSGEQVWFSVENIDGECTWMMTRAQWEQLKELVERKFP